MKGKPAVIISALFGLLACLMVWLYLRAKEAELLQLAEAHSVVLAAQDLLPGRAIEESMLTETEVPRVFVQPGAHSSIRDVLGQIPAVPIPAGAQVTGTALTRVGQGLATKIPRGKRAVSVAVNDVSGVAGLIRPNNFVDIVAIVKTGGGSGASDQTTFVTSVFQNVLVLAVGDDTGTVRATDLAPSDQEALDILTNRSSETVRSVTVALTPQDVQNLILAQEVGELTLSLRSYLERDSSLELVRSTPGNVLGVERVLPRQQPSWMEIRGEGGR